MIKIYCDEKDQDMFIETLIEYDYCPQEREKGISALKDVFDEKGNWIDEEFICEFKGDCEKCLKANYIFLNGEER